MRAVLCLGLLPNIISLEQTENDDIKSDDILDNNFCLFLKNEIFETQ